MRSEILELQAKIKQAGPITFLLSELAMDLISNDPYAIWAFMDMYQNVGGMVVDLTFVPGGESIVRIRQVIRTEKPLIHFQSHSYEIAITPDNVKSVTIVSPTCLTDWTNKLKEIPYDRYYEKYILKAVPMGLRFEFHHHVVANRSATWPFVNTHEKQEFRVDLSEITVWFSRENVARSAEPIFRQWVQAGNHEPSVTPTQLSDFDPPASETFQASPAKPGRVSRVPKANIDISNLFIASDGIYARAPLDIDEHFKGGRAIALHNADYLEYDQKKDRFLLRADFSELILPGHHFSSWDHSLDADSVRFERAQDGFANLRIGASLIALKNVTQIDIDRAHMQNGQVGTAFELRFASGAIAHFLVADDNITNYIQMMNQVPFLLARGNSADQDSLRYQAINTLSIVVFRGKTDDKTSGSTGEPASATLLDQRVQYLDAFAPWNGEMPAQYPMLPCHNYSVRLDYAWSVQRLPEGQANGGAALISFNNVVDRPSDFPMARPWYETLPWDPLIGHLASSARWIEVNGTWFNVSRAVSAQRDGQDIVIDNSTYGGATPSVSHNRLRGNPYAVSLLAALGF